MPVESAADLAGFFDPDEHGTVAQVNGAPPYVNGIFGNAYLETLGGGDEAGLGTRAPQFSFAEADASRIKEGDTLRFGTLDAAGAFTGNHDSYKVAGPPEPDGTGVVVVQLHKR